jgi:hypothetical protein
MVGWYLDVVVGYLIRIVIRGVRARGSSTWPVEKRRYQIHDVPLRRMEDQSPRLAIRIRTKGTISLGVHRMPFLLRGSAEDYVARFPSSSDVVIRVKPGEPEVSLVYDEDQSS